MQNQVNWRFVTVLAVTVLAALFVVPSMDYFYALSTTEIPHEEEFIEDGVFDEAAFTSETLLYNDIMTGKRRGMPVLGRPLPLGLDLQGGVDVLLSVSRQKTLEDELREAAGRIRDKIRDDDIDAEVGLSAANDGILIRLKDPTLADNVQMVLESYGPNFQPWEEKYLRETGGLILRFKEEVIDRYAKEAIQGAIETVRRRVDELGVTMPTVQMVGNQYIRVQVPGEKDPQQVIDLVIRPARLEFRLVHPEQSRYIHQEIEVDDYGNIISGQLPSRHVLMFGEAQGASQDDPAANEFTIKVKSDIRAKEQEKKVGFYIIRDLPELTGKDLIDARYSFNPSNVGSSPHEVNIEFDKEGTRVFRQLTRDHLDESMAIILEGEVVSAPKLVAHITDGRARITGSFEADEARNLSLILRAGALPAHLKAEHQQAVGPTLGADSIRQGLQALAVGSVMVLLFMVVYYAGAGVIAVLALAVNLTLVLAMLALFRATLTLSGIGGILLTVGMAVDANVLIFERLREEVKRSGSIKAILNAGFGKAFSTIFDANVTTLITALVLLQFGSATMQGFALTMTFGIFATLFTGLVVTRVFTDVWALPRGKISLGALRIVREAKIDFLRLRHGAYILSFCLLLVGVVGLVQNKGLKLGVDFASGVTATVDFSDKAINESAIRDALPDARVQRVLDRGYNQFIVTHKLVNDDVGDTNKYLRENLNQTFADGFRILGSEGVGRAVGAQFTTKAFLCVFISALCILAFVWFRFELSFGAAAVVALFHDIILTLGILEFLNIELSLEVVAALLMVFGYSINDTIVVFDRIRENMGAVFGKKIEELLNLSVNQCLSRTLITSATTLLALLAMLWLGGEGLRDFAVTLLIGLFIGTYSSVFVATPTLYEWRRRRAGALTERTEEAGGEDQGEAGTSEANGRRPPRPKKETQGPRTRGRRVAPLR